MKNKGNIALWTLVAIIILSAILVLGSESKKKMEEVQAPLITEEQTQIQTEETETETKITAELDSIQAELEGVDTDSLDQGL